MTGRKPKSKKKCYVCGDPVEGLGLCNRHYHRLKKYGSPYILKNRPDGTGTIDDGYVSIMKNKQRKKEHVWVVEEILGKELPKGAIVHHVDGNRSNNVPSNLVVCQNRSHHMLIHKRKLAYEACGMADFRQCRYCKAWVSVTELVYADRRHFHKECRLKYSREYARTRAMGGAVNG